MRKHQIRNLPVVDDRGCFVGLFGIRRLSHMLLPRAATEFSGHSLSDLSFLPDEEGQMHERLHKAGNRPVSEFLEKKKRLIFCTPSTSYPELLRLLNTSADSSLPVIVVKGRGQKLVGMVSFWDILEKITREVFAQTEIPKSHSNEVD
jgi:CBS domain-containing protein